jgi:hypothetical protein
MYVNEYGIKLYTHKCDGSSCNLLNSFNINLDEAIYQYKSQYTINELFSCSKKIRKEVYFKFSKEKEYDKAVKMLNNMGKIFINDLELFKEFTYVFTRSKVIKMFNDNNIDITCEMQNVKIKPDELKEFMDYFQKLLLPSCLNTKQVKIGNIANELKKKINKINNRNEVLKWNSF